jgi:hypothetical protein
MKSIAAVWRILAEQIGTKPTSFFLSALCAPCGKIFEAIEPQSTQGSQRGQERRLVRNLVAAVTVRCENCAKCELPPNLKGVRDRLRVGHGVPAMENKELLIIYVICWMIYVGIVHTYAARFGLSRRTVVASHLVPSAVAVLMSLIFLVMGGATVRQLAGGPGAGLWSLWVALWPLLLLVTFASAFGLRAGSWRLASRGRTGSGCRSWDWRRSCRRLRS